MREQLASSDIAKRPPEEAAKLDARLRILALCLYLGWLLSRGFAAGYRVPLLENPSEAIPDLWAFLGVTGILLLLTVLALSISMVYQRSRWTTRYRTRDTQCGTQKHFGVVCILVLLCVALFARVSGICSLPALFLAAFFFLQGRDVFCHAFLCCGSPHRLIDTAGGKPGDAGCVPCQNIHAL